MISKVWFRFGIPLGSATVVAGLLEFALATYWFLNDLGSFILLHYHGIIKGEEDPTVYGTYGSDGVPVLTTVPAGSKSILGLVIVSLRLILTIILWSFILNGRRNLLLSWLPSTIIVDLIVVYHAIANYASLDGSYWVTSTVGILVLLLYRIYITSIFFQTYKRLQLNDTVVVQTGNDLEKNQNSLEAANQNLQIPRPEGEGESTSFSRILLVEPIGESLGTIWTFYHETPRLGAAVLLLFELFWNVFTLSTRCMTDGLWGGGIFFMIREEEVLMRIWRVTIDLVALYLVFKKKKTLLRFWLILYFWTLFSSLSLFVYVIVDWHYPPSVQVLIMLIFLLGDCIQRFGILYFVLRTTTQPPVVTPTTSGELALNPTPLLNLKRTHSLESQDGEMVIAKCRKKIQVGRSDRKKYGSQRRLRILMLASDPGIDII